MKVVGFNIIAPVSRSYGVAIHARHLIRMLTAKGYAVAVFDYPPEMDLACRDCTYDELIVDNINNLPYDINLLVFDIRTLCSFLSKYMEYASLPDKLNAGLIVWELTVIPKAWLEALRFIDVFLCASNFIRYTFETKLANPMTVYLPCAIDLPKLGIRERKDFGVADDKVAFICSFDAGSGYERKNPFATLDAFGRAFGNSDNAQLVIKLTNNNQTVDSDSLLQELSEYVKNIKNIKIIDKNFSYADTLSLYDCCDVYVSLHRSEGFGLGLIETMLLGKPVIATAWSGNMSYMNFNNSCLVQYSLKPVESSHPNFDRKFIGSNALWAEANVEHAAMWMRALASDPELRASIGKEARSSIVNYNESAERLGFINELETVWCFRDYLPRRSFMENFDKDVLTLATQGKEMTVIRKIGMKARRIFADHVAWRFN